MKYKDEEEKKEPLLSFEFLTILPFYFLKHFAYLYLRLSHLFSFGPAIVTKHET